MTENEEIQQLKSELLKTEEKNKLLIKKINNLNERIKNETRIKKYRKKNHIVLRHDEGAFKTVKKGFSWTMLFFGGIVPLTRGDLKWFIISFLLATMTLGISSIILPFFYNKIYLNERIEKGWIVCN